MSITTSSLPNIRMVIQSHSVGVPRVALQDFTFSDGTFIPAGTTIAATAWCIHMDENYYEDPTVFKPWRFLGTRAEEGNKYDSNPWKEGKDADTKQHFVSTSSNYLAFGHGKHAWYDMFIFSVPQREIYSLLSIYSYSPGRFFAVTELKIMMAHILLNYDIKFEDGTQSPENLWHATTITPDPNVKLLFRKRRN